MATMTPWMIASLVAFAVAVTLATNWLAARISRSGQRLLISPGAILASLVWIALVTVAGTIASRYIERLANVLLGYLAFGIVAFFLSLLRAILHRRIESQPKPLRIDRLLGIFLTDWPRNLTYLFAATIAYLSIAILVQQPIEPVLFIPLAIGALLPDLDSTSSLLGRLLPCISRRLEAWLGHLHEWHTPAAAGIIALLIAPMLFVTSVQAWSVVPLGFVSHLIVDLLHPEGILLLWPLSKRRFHLFGGLPKTPGDRTERKLAAVLALIALVLLVVVDIGPAPPRPVTVPSYQQTLERYYSLRGRNLVTAYIEGSWQATGRRGSGRFEVINAADESYVMLDRYTSRVFTVGRTAADNFYPSHVSLQTGPAARVKPIEIHLEGQQLAEALSLVYQMQREPGLQHIFVSGDIVVPALQDTASPALPIEYSQASIRKIQSHDAGHYSLHYLSASELIALSGVQVDIADLIIWATYIEAGAEPTVTPLPLPAATPDGSP